MQHLIMFLVDDDLGDITNLKGLEELSDDLRGSTHMPMRHEEIFEIGSVSRGTVAGRALVDKIVAAVDQMQLSLQGDTDLDEDDMELTEGELVEMDLSHLQDVARENDVAWKVLARRELLQILLDLLNGEK
jgi:hypothetical protein